jgi:hypothetical protein
MKRFLIVVLWVFITFIVMSIGLIIFVQTSNKTIINELKKQLNKYLLTEVQINNIQISSLKNFPNITVILDKVVVKEEPKESGSNLAELDQVNLVINLIDFIRKDYIIQKVICSNGKINIRRYLNNTYNYDVWKTTTNDSSKSTVNFEIKKAIFQNINLYFIDYVLDYNFTAIVNKCDLKGKLTESPYKIVVRSKTKDLKLIVHKRNLTIPNLVEIQTVLDYDADNEIFQLHQSKLWIDENKIEIDGSYIYYFKNEQSRIDLVFKAKSLNFSTIFDYLPDTYKYKFKDYMIKGDLSCKAIVKGVYDSSRFPSIHVDFNTDNAELTSNKDNFSIEQIKLKGTFANDGKNKLASYKISVPEFQGVIDKNDFRGNIVIHDFSNPYINLNFKSKINLKTINPLIKSSGFIFDSGYADLDLSYKGKIKGIKTMSDQERIDVKLLLESVGIKDKTGNKIEKLNGNIQITENQVIVKKLSAYINQSSYSFEGNIVGLIPYLLKNSLNLEINGNIDIDKIDLTAKKKISNKYNQSFILPELNGLDFDVNLKLGELIIPSFTATELNGNIKVKNENIIAKNLIFKTSYGSGIVTGMLSKSPRNEITFEGQSVLSKIDLNKLFVQFKNFGQKNITDKNLKGFADAKIEIIFSFDSNFNFIQSGLYTLADITISNGELINYQTIQNLFGFIKLKKMNYILFDKIQNTIIIKDRRIDIPKMTMNSSAFNMEVQGWHTFDNQMEYNMKINLTKLFFGKNKIDKTQFENSEDDTKGGINLYVKMYGDGTDPQFKFNKSSIKEKVNDGIGKQKKDMHDIIQKKKDEKKGKNDKQNNNTDFELEWDDN